MSPSMNVMALFVDAVFMNAGSSVTYPVLARSCAMSMRALVFGADDDGHLELGVPQRDGGLVGHGILRAARACAAL